jgi:hypothetical protein
MGGIGGVEIGLHNAVLPHHIEILMDPLRLIRYININHKCQSMPMDHCCPQPPPPGYGGYPESGPGLYGRAGPASRGEEWTQATKRILLWRDKGCFYSSVSSHVRPPPASKVKPDPDEDKQRQAPHRHRRCPSLWRLLLPLSLSAVPDWY